VYHPPAATLPDQKRKNTHQKAKIEGRKKGGMGTDKEGGEGEATPKKKKFFKLY